MVQGWVAGQINLHYIKVAAATSIFTRASEIERNFGVDVFEDTEIERHTDATLQMLLGASVQHPIVSEEQVPSTPQS